jgi:hypothetical protein
LVALALWVLVGCGGKAEPQASSSSTATASSTSTTYVAALKPTYHEAWNSFRATITPCVNQQYAACETRTATARADAATLVEQLNSVEVPASAKAANQDLVAGFESLIAATDKQQQAIEAGDEAAFIASISEVKTALRAIDEARGQLNGMFPSLSLSPMFPEASS